MCALHDAGDRGGGRSRTLQPMTHRAARHRRTPPETEGALRGRERRLRTDAGKDDEVGEDRHALVTLEILATVAVRRVFIPKVKRRRRELDFAPVPLGMHLDAVNVSGLEQRYGETT